MDKKDFLILVVDDEENFRNFLYDALSPKGYTVDSACDGNEGLDKIKSNDYDLVFVDIRMPFKDGITLLKEALQIKPSQHIITMSALNDLETVIQAIKSGAFHFLKKPIDIDLLFKLVKQSEKYKQISVENKKLKEQLKYYENSNNPIIGNSPALLNEIDKAKKIAKTDASCIIFGESGTGKELISELIHAKSLRRKGPFYKINCAAIPLNLLESELFGYEKGAFTGAYQTKKGMFELANTGTLFLDEIGDMELSLQAKILRVLENGEFYRIGGQKAIKTQVRTISATNQDLLDKIENNSFREDLYYRLNVVSITLPPLRERTNDIPLLTKYFIQKLSRKNNSEEKDLSKESLSHLMTYPFNGNIRELKNMLERALVMSNSSTIEISDILEENNLQTNNNNEIDIKLQIGTTLSSLETVIIKKVLAFFNNDKVKTAESLGVSTRKIFYKIKEKVE